MQYYKKVQGFDTSDFMPIQKYNVVNDVKIVDGKNV